MSSPFGNMIEKFLNRDEAPDNLYHEEKEVNGLNIIVTWDRSSGKYILNFELGESEEAEPLIIDISKNSELAKQVFRQAVALAQGGLDLEKIVLEIKQFIKINKTTIH